ncbi:hypothetical protein LTR66_000599 [Elasticomyces elasticus]|nr:hypothetical protein LTR66_000599 [Elasticomyces elasticus]
MRAVTTGKDHLLLSIAFSHYNEKARWAFAYYGVPYTHHLLLPALHIFSIRTFASNSDLEFDQKDSDSSPYSTPCLVVSDPSRANAQLIFRDSHDILVYLSEAFPSSERPDLYTSCGVDQTEQIKALEKRYDDVLGVATRCIAYYDMLVLNRWRSLLSFALLGFRNRVGLLQSILWFLLSPLIGRLLIWRMECTTSRHRESMVLCREEFERASKLLEDSEYLAGKRLSAADITFAALAYPVLHISHEEGYQQYPPGSKTISSEGRAFMTELRATRAGQHVLRLFKEERDCGSLLPRQRKTVLRLW